MMDLSEIDSKQGHNKLAYWIGQLRDGGRRNRLLFFKDTQISSVVITDPDHFELFEQIVVQSKPVFAPLSPANGQRNSFDDKDAKDTRKSENDQQREPDEFLANKPIDRLNRALSNLRYRARTIREEQGFNALYLTFGMLRWREGTSGEYAEAPLILVPIDIVREGAADRFRIEVIEEEIIVNPTLQAKLAQDFAIEIAEISNDISSDEYKAALAAIETLVADFQGWGVQNKVALGIFNFQTLMIIKDLERNAEHYLQHPLIRMLSGYLGQLLEEPENVPSAADLDEQVNPDDVFQILDADSSQQEAIEAAKRGVSFVLQGPPGTGKSQTIANIIAESLAAGKKVLFVSQKSVALAVVHNRLAGYGLTDFCLEIHSYKKSKLDVIRDLGKTLADIAQPTQPDTSNKKRELVQVREGLNQYVRELHRPRLGMQMSLYRVLGEQSTLHAEPDLKFAIHDISTIDVSQHQHHLSLIRELVTYDEIILNYQSHPWKGFTQKSVGIQKREEIATKFEAASNAIFSLGTDLNAFALEAGLFELETIQHLGDLLTVLEEFSPAIFHSDYADRAERILTQYGSVARIIRPQYWLDLRAIEEIGWKHERLPLDALRNILNTARRLRATVSSDDARTVDNPSVKLEKVNDWLVKNKIIRQALVFAQSLFDTNELPEPIKPGTDSAYTSVATWFDERAGQTDQIPEMVNFNGVLKIARETGLEDFVDQAISNGIPPSKWQNTYMRRFFTVLSDEIIQLSKVLAKFRSSTHSSLIERFRQLDDELLASAALEIRSRLTQLRPEATWVQANSAETTILRKELNKKRRIKPLRRLFAEIPNLILRLKPCLMMSPLTVSQLLDPELIEFDIAIFDEASQIPPEYAIGTIMRARQVVIAGDRHQLPPTSFFQSIDKDDFDEEDYEVEDYESILNACDAVSMPNKMLLWHYRSEDESLIAFSNYNFYDNQLLTFPNANSDTQRSGLKFIHVSDGVYRRGHGARDNPIEARKVAELVLAHFEETPDSSLGVVTFSQSQRHAIDMQVDRLKHENQHLQPLFDYNKDEEFFVKNLETVQGDERDVIIFSVGYGKDELGNMRMNFGPLNRQGGERRLNVAVTRARRAMKLVASILPEDIDLSRTQSRGARLLRSYMKVARDGPNAVFEDEIVDTEAEFGSPFEEAVFSALSQRGILLHKQVGVSRYRIDLGVVDPDQPGRFLLGIECDGRTYHSAPTARDRDRLRQQLLEDKFGWRIHRIWSPDWINDRSREIDKVLAAIDSSKKLGPRIAVKKN